MPTPLSALDCVSPALKQTALQLFKPFRVPHWLRMGVVCMVTGEFAGGGGWGGNFSVPNLPHRRGTSTYLVAGPGTNFIHTYLPWILLGLAVGAVLLLLWVYIASVYRFILFDAVLNDRCDLRAGWRRWRQHGRSYFGFAIGLMFATFATLLVLLGGPVLLAWRAGLFRHPGAHIALLILGGLALFAVALGVLVLSGLTALFAKDFAIPVMAMEGVGILEAWRKVLPMLSRGKATYAGYVLAKVVLALGSAIIFGIITLFFILALLLPLGVAGVAGYLIAKAAGLVWGTVMMCLAVAVGGVALMGLIYVVALISVPAMVFFQSYVLHFFGSRYSPLGAVLFAAPPAPVEQ